MAKRIALATADQATERMVVTQDLQRSDIEILLISIQNELDEIGATFGMQQRRSELKARKDELLDRLLELRIASA